MTHCSVKTLHVIDNLLHALNKIVRYLLGMYHRSEVVNNSPAGNPSYYWSSEFEEGFVFIFQPLISWTWKSENVCGLLLGSTFTHSKREICWLRKHARIQVIFKKKITFSLSIPMVKCSVNINIELFLEVEISFSAVCHWKNVLWSEILERCRGNRNLMLLSWLASAACFS